MPRILLIDDDDGLREVLAFALEEFGHEVESHSSGASGLSCLEAFKADVVITDLKMPGMDGVEVVRQVKAVRPNVPVIVLTAFGSVGDAVEVMKLGAFDYLTKPYNRDELRLTVDQALERTELVRENRTLRNRLREETRKVEVIYASSKMEAVVQRVQRIAPSDATVLITGESGTGKEVIAHAIHGYSERWERAFVAINCAAIPRDLMEAELFGHARGAFSGATRDKPGKFQRASGGTLLLDEIGDLSADLQAKLLRVIETGQVDVVGGQSPVQVDVRLVAATNANLEERVSSGQFREDLFYRLNVIPVHIPPLRERRDDVPALWNHFVSKYAQGTTIRTSAGLMRMLMQRNWPGNVRELANVCQRMVLLRESDLLDENALAVVPEESATEARGGASAVLGDLPEGGLSLPELEREVIVRALAMHDGNRSRTAEYLGVARHVLTYRLEKYKIL